MLSTASRHKERAKEAVHACEGKRRREPHTVNARETAEPGVTHGTH